MTVIVNGESREIAVPVSVAQLLEDLGSAADRVATMVNDEVVARTARPTRMLSDGDRVEVLTFAGGG